MPAALLLLFLAACRAHPVLVISPSPPETRVLSSCAAHLSSSRLPQRIAQEERLPKLTHLDMHTYEYALTGRATLPKIGVVRVNMECHLTPVELLPGGGRLYVSR